MLVLHTRDAEGEMSSDKQHILEWLIPKFQKIRKQKERLEERMFEHSSENRDNTDMCLCICG
jgi:hypothetical protein